MLYYYRALNSKGDEVTDYIDAPNETAAKQKIRKSGLYVTFIKDQEIVKASQARFNIREFFDRALLNFRKNSAKKQVGLFSRQLSTLLKAGMPLMVAITDIIEQIDNNIFKNVIIDIKEKVEGGSDGSAPGSRRHL